MSLFNQLGEYGLNQLIARRLTTPGPAPSPTVEPALFPTLVLENDRPEWGFTKGERLCAGAGGVAAVAAQYSEVSIANPSGSNMICTIESVSMLPGATSVAGLLTQSALALAPFTGAVRDARWVQPGSTSARPTCQPSAGTSLVLPPDASILRIPSATFVTRDVSIIVPPGWQFVLVGITVNVGFTAFEVQWRERTAQPGEL